MLESKDRCWLIVDVLEKYTFQALSRRKTTHF
jgi:hypothetical protein